MAKRPQEAGAALESIELIGRTAQDELRVVLGLLRDEQADAAALVPAPRLADLKELADTVRASGIPVELRTWGADRQLSPALELTLLRNFASEALVFGAFGGWLVAEPLATGFRVLAEVPIEGAA